MNKLLIIAAIFAASIASTANADSIYLGALSTHYRGGETYTTPSECALQNVGPCQTLVDEHELNTTNDLIAVEYKGYVLGRLNNTYRQEVFFAVKQFQVAKVADIGFYADIGLTHGYKNCDYTGAGAKAKTCAQMSVEVIYEKYAFQPLLIINNKAASLSVRYRFD